MALGSAQSLVKTSTRNIPGGKGGRCVRLSTSPPSCAECHEIWEPKPPGTLWATPGLLRDSFKFYVLYFRLVHHGFQMPPEVRSGGLGGHSTGALRPLQWSGNSRSNQRRTQIPVPLITMCGDFWITHMTYEWSSAGFSLPLIRHHTINMCRKWRYCSIYSSHWH